MPFPMGDNSKFSPEPELMNFNQTKQEATLSENDLNLFKLREIIGDCRK